MSCVPCEEVEKAGDIAYVRVDKANVGLIGCDMHVGIILDSLQVLRDEGIEIQPRERTIYRIKGDLKK